MQIEVLQEVGCIDTELVVQLKGRVACEINSGDELIATECLFDNQLGDLTAAEAVALLSALVFQQKDASEPLLTPRLAEAKDRYFLKISMISNKATGVVLKYPFFLRSVQYCSSYYLLY